MAAAVSAATASSLRMMASIEKSVGFLIALAACCSWLAVPIIIIVCPRDSFDLCYFARARKERFYGNGGDDDMARTRTGTEWNGRAYCSNRCAVVGAACTRLCGTTGRVNVAILKRAATATAATAAAVPSPAPLRRPTAGRGARWEGRVAGARYRSRASPRTHRQATVPPPDVPRVGGAFPFYPAALARHTAAATTRIRRALYLARSPPPLER